MEELPKKVWLILGHNPVPDPSNMGLADLTGLNSAAFATLFPPVQTAADGRVQIKGIGRERVVGLRVEGPTIATQQLRAMTRPAESDKQPSIFSRASP